MHLQRPSRSFLALAALAGPAVFALSAASVVRADTVVLKDGTTHRGRVVEHADRVELYVCGKKRVFPRERVRSCETDRQTCARRLAALDAKDLEGHLELAEWCEQARLRREAKRVRERILVAHPDHRPTRKALGYVRHEGRWITRADYMRGLKLKKSGDGKSWITPEQRAQEEAAARAKAQEREVEAVLRRTQLDGVAAVITALAPFSDAAAVPPLSRALRSETVALRRLAAQELGRRRARAAEVALAKAAVRDTRSAVRKEALKALGRLGGTRTRAQQVFLRGLEQESVFKRAHAAAALAALPTRRAVPILIQKLRETTSGFGIVNISIKTERAYIQDFELTSGGTGQTVAEVADPVIGKSTEGITLEVKVVQWYREAIIGALNSSSGRSFGNNPGAWERWWKKNGKK